jgi:hypothetical protein
MEAHDQKLQALRFRHAQQHNLKSLIRSAPHRGDFAHHFIFPFLRVSWARDLPIGLCKSTARKGSKIVSTDPNSCTHFDAAAALHISRALFSSSASKILLLIDHDLRRSHPLPFLTLETKTYDFL